MSIVPKNKTDRFTVEANEYEELQNIFVHIYQPNNWTVISTTKYPVWSWKKFRKVYRMELKRN